MTVGNLREPGNIIHHPIREAWGGTDKDHGVVANVFLQLLRVHAAGLLVDGDLDKGHVKVLGRLIKGGVRRHRCYDGWVRDV